MKLFVVKDGVDATAWGTTSAGTINPDYCVPSDGLSHYYAALTVTDEKAWTFSDAVSND